MDSNLSLKSLLSLITLLIFIHTPANFCQNNEYVRCGDSFSCANIENIGYPFWGGSRPAYCAHPSFELDCSKDLPEITIQSVKYRVVNYISNRSQTATIARDDLLSNICPSNPRNASLDFNLFSYHVSPGDQNITLFYGCTVIAAAPFNPIPNLFNCSEDNSNNSNRNNVLWSPSAGLPNILPAGISIKCRSEIFVTVTQGAFQALRNASLVSEELLRTSVGGGFLVEWKANNSLCQDCMRSGGRCGSNGISTQFVCYCANGTSSSSTCSDLDSILLSLFVISLLFYTLL